MNALSSIDDLDLNSSRQVELYPPVIIFAAFQTRQIYTYENHVFFSNSLTLSITNITTKYQDSRTFAEHYNNRTQLNKKHIVELQKTVPSTKDQMAKIDFL